jgi:hypothetical protein
MLVGVKKGLLRGTEGNALQKGNQRTHLLNYYISITPISKTCKALKKWQDRFPLHQDGCLPDKAHASIAIFEGMNDLELIMKNRAGRERMFIGTCRASPRDSPSGSKTRFAGGACARAGYP